MGLTAMALAPGLIAGDRPFQISLCGDPQEPSDACTHSGLAASAQRGWSR